MNRKSIWMVVALIVTFPIFGLAQTGDEIDKTTEKLNSAEKLWEMGSGRPNPKEPHGPYLSKAFTFDTFFAKSGTSGDEFSKGARYFVIQSPIHSDGDHLSDGSKRRPNEETLFVKIIFADGTVAEVKLHEDALIGIPKFEIGKAFNRFYDADPATGYRYPGPAYTKVVKQLRSQSVGYGWRDDNGQDPVLHLRELTPEGLQYLVALMKGRTFHAKGGGPYPTGSHLRNVHFELDPQEIPLPKNSDALVAPIRPVPATTPTSRTVLVPLTHTPGNVAPAIRNPRR